MNEAETKELARPATARLWPAVPMPLRPLALSLLVNLRNLRNLRTFLSRHFFAFHSALIISKSDIYHTREGRPY